MRISLDGEYREINTVVVNEELLNYIINNVDVLFGSAFRYCYGSMEMMRDAFNGENDYEGITVIPYAIYIDKLLAGIVFLEDVSSEDEDFFDVNIACAIVKQFRGLGLVGKAVDIICSCESVDTAYYIVHKDNLSSLKAAKGFSMCSNQEVHFGDKNPKDFIKLVKHYNKF